MRKEGSTNSVVFFFLRLMAGIGTFCCCTSGTAIIWRATEALRQKLVISGRAAFGVLFHQKNPEIRTDSSIID